MVPLVRLPPTISKLTGLESLVLSGHDIVSDGVPAELLDGYTMPHLKRLEFGRKPVRVATWT